MEGSSGLFEAIELSKEVRGKLGWIEDAAGLDPTELCREDIGKLVWAGLADGMIEDSPEGRLETIELTKEDSGKLG